MTINLDTDQLRFWLLAPPWAQIAQADYEILIESTTPPSLEHLPVFTNHPLTTQQLNHLASLMDQEPPFPTSSALDVRRNQPPPLDQVVNPSVACGG